jgi:hypothetical protein
LIFPTVLYAKLRFLIQKTCPETPQRRIVGQIYLLLRFFDSGKRRRALCNGNFAGKDAEGFRAFPWLVVGDV